MKHCLACKGELFEQPLLTLDHMPASAQDIPGAGQLEADQGITLRLCQCRCCGLVQFDCEPVHYYKEVIRAGGFSTTMADLRRKQYARLIDLYGLAGKRFLEAGCGRGEFLSVLQEFPVRAYGIEQRAELVTLARQSGLMVWQDFALDCGSVLADPDNAEAKPPYDVFLSFNFLEHQPDPSGMLAAIRANLAADGIGLLTVPSFEYILEHDGYYELIRDHLAYYTFDSLGRLLHQNGFQVLEQELVNRDTLAVIVRKQDGPGPAAMPPLSGGPLDVTRLRESRVKISRELEAWRCRLAAENKTAALWGASHQGFTLAATAGLEAFVSYIIDSAPFKQGLYAPASHIPIVSPDYFAANPVDAVLIVAPGYTDEIAGIIRERMRGQGKEVEILALRSSSLEQLG